MTTNVTVTGSGANVSVNNQNADATVNSSPINVSIPRLGAQGPAGPGGGSGGIDVLYDFVVGDSERLPTGATWDSDTQTLTVARSRHFHSGNTVVSWNGQWLPTADFETTRNTVRIINPTLKYDRRNEFIVAGSATDTEGGSGALDYDQLKEHLDAGDGVTFDTDDSNETITINASGITKWDSETSYTRGSVVWYDEDDYIYVWDSDGANSIPGQYPGFDNSIPATTQVVEITVPASGYPLPVIGFWFDGNTGLTSPVTSFVSASNALSVIWSTLNSRSNSPVTATVLQSSNTIRLVWMEAGAVGAAAAGGMGGDGLSAGFGIMPANTGNLFSSNIIQVGTNRIPKPAPEWRRIGPLNYVAADSDTENSAVRFLDIFANPSVDNGRGLGFGVRIDGILTNNGNCAIAGATASNSLAVAIGESCVSSGNSSNALGNQCVASGNAATAIGDSARATGAQAVAIGVSQNLFNKDHVAEGDQSLSIGYRSRAAGDRSITVGYRSESTGVESIAKGNQAIVTSSYSLGIGSRVNVNAARGIAIGYNTSASDSDCFVVGSNSTGNGNKSATIGVSLTTIGDRSINLGKSSRVDGTDAQSVGIDNFVTGSQVAAAGRGNHIHGTASGAVGGLNQIGRRDSEDYRPPVDSDGPDRSVSLGVAIGAQNLVLSDRGIAMGTLNRVDSDATRAMAYGYGNTVGDSDGIVIGNNSTQTGVASITIGRDISGSGNRTVLIGDDINASAASLSVGIGNSIEVASDSTAVGYDAHASASNSTAYGQEARATANNSTAIGQDAQATGTNSTAMGKGSRATINDATAIGDRCEVDGQDGTAVGYSCTISSSGINGTAFGMGADVGASGGVAYGRNATVPVGGTNALAVGIGARAEAAESVAVGSQVGTNPARAAGTRAAAFGPCAHALGDRSLAIGTECTVDSDHHRSVVIGDNVDSTDSDQCILGNDTHKLKLPFGNAPATASSPGTAGEFRLANGFIYVCVATDTWQRAALTTF